MNIKKMETDQLGHVVTAEELTIDEGAIIREQERLAQEKKKKIRRKRRNILIAILGVLVAGCVTWYWIWGKKVLSGGDRTTVVIQATANQSVMFVKVDSISGNEISYTVLQEQTTGTSDTEPQNQNEGEGRPQSSGNSDFSEKMPDGAGGFEVPGEMPDGAGGFEFPEGMSGYQGGPGSGSSDAAGMNGNHGNGGQRGSGAKGTGGSSEQRTLGTFVLQYNGVGYNMTDETATALIPVGTKVTTKLGTETTFSRIAAGDCLALVTEIIDGEETIMAVYIVG
ncbi:MAG: hypothetical protein ACI4HQ_09660 [Acetatifactor sp.]